MAGKTKKKIDRPLLRKRIWAPVFVECSEKARGRVLLYTRFINIFRAEVAVGLNLPEVRSVINLTFLTSRWFEISYREQRDRVHVHLYLTHNFGYLSSQEKGRERCNHNITD